MFYSIIAMLSFLTGEGLQEKVLGGIWKSKSTVQIRESCETTGTRGKSRNLLLWIAATKMEHTCEHQAREKEAGPSEMAH